MLSVIVPAHNESELIGETLRSMVADSDSEEFEVLVVCNGCVDDTADRARSVEGPIRVLETTRASKSLAINLGAENARFQNLVICDADIKISYHDLRQLAEALEEQPILAAAPAVRTLFEKETSSIVRGFYRFWMSLPYIKEGMVCAGVYALSAVGAQRVLPLPNVIADDGFVRASFTSSERKEVTSAVSGVRAPTTVGALIRIRTRSRLGQYQLRDLRPDLEESDTASRNYFTIYGGLLLSPTLWLPALSYIYITLVSRLRANRQYREQTEYAWERDDSSRKASGVWEPSKAANSIPEGDN